jgi:hypothetical protein
MNDASKYGLILLFYGAIVGHIFLYLSGINIVPVILFELGASALLAVIIGASVVLADNLV